MHVEFYLLFGTTCTCIFWCLHLISIIRFSLVPVYVLVSLIQQSSSLSLITHLVKGIACNTSSRYSICVFMYINLRHIPLFQPISNLVGRLPVILVQHFHKITILSTMGIVHQWKAWGMCAISCSNLFINYIAGHT